MAGIDPRALAGLRVEHRDGVDGHGCAVEGQGAEAAITTDEVRHEVIGGCAQQLLRSGVLGQFAAAGKNGHAVSESNGLVDVVGDENNGAV